MPGFLSALSNRLAWHPVHLHPLQDQYELVYDLVGQMTGKKY